MRTNIDIDEELLKSVMEKGGFKTKKATVEAALKELAYRQAVKALMDLKGAGWDGDLDAMRLDTPG